MVFSYNGSYIVFLNVGGVEFVTELVTLDKDRPNNFENILNKSNWWKKDREKSVFIDRDPEVFKYILKYLRGYTLDFKSGDLSNRSFLIQVLDDANYFELNGLIRMIENILYPKPSIIELKNKLKKLDQEYSQEFRIHNLDETPEGYLSFTNIAEKEFKLNDFKFRQLLEGQRRYREHWIKEWKTKRYCNSFQKIIISFCTLLEYLSPNSPFTQNLSKTVFVKLNSGQLKETVQDLAEGYIENEGTEMSPTMRLMVNLIVLIYLQGLLQPELEERDEKDEEEPGKINLESLIRQHPELQPAYEDFKREKARLGRR